jgi:hypothetical protein
MKQDDIQHGGLHYKQYGDMQPWNVVAAWGLGYFDGTALKYLARWRFKNGIEDLKKARHFIDKLIELETENPSKKETKHSRSKSKPKCIACGGTNSTNDKICLGCRSGLTK